MNAVSERLPAAAEPSRWLDDSRLGQALARAQRQENRPLADALTSYAEIRERLREKRPEAALTLLEDWRQRRATRLADARAEAQAAGRELPAKLPPLRCSNFPEVQELEQPELGAALQSLARLKRWTEAGKAREQLTGALGLQLTRAEAHNVLGVLHAEEGEFDQAAHDFAAAVRADTGHYRALTNQVALRLHQLDDLPEGERQAELERAETELRRSLALNDEQHAAYQNLAVVLRSKGDRAGSVAAAKRASHLDSRRSDKQGQDVAQRELKRMNGFPLWGFAALAAAALAVYWVVAGLAGH